MDLQLKGKTAFISGSTSGIGLAVAKILLQEGANVVINGRKQPELDKATEQLQNLVGASQFARGIAADLGNPEDTARLIEALPKCDILINNVGIYKSTSFYETSDADWQSMLNVNLMSGVRLSKALLPQMLDRNWGRILFISSECATLVPEDLIAYSTTKAALLALSRGLAQLTSGTGVTVNAATPGSTLTEGAEAFLENLAKEKNQSIQQVEAAFFKETRTSSLLERFADVLEIAHTLTYYCSPLSAATNGAVIRLDGGSMGGLY